MARYHVTQNSTFPYHITDRSPNREHFPLALDKTWEILCDFLYLAHHKNGLRIHQFVLMPNHFHLVASVTDVPLGKVLCEFLSSSSKAMNLESRRANQRWGDRSYKCEIASYHYLTNTYKYVYQNPVRAGLVSRVEEWPYSSLHGILGQSKLTLPLERDLTLFPEDLPAWDESILKWLNMPVPNKALVDFRTALRKRSFKLPKVSGKAHFLEEKFL